MILVDANVLIDVFNRDSDWFDWSRGQIGGLTSSTTLAVNPVVVSEVAWSFERLDGLVQLLADMLIGFEPLDAHAGYRERRGPDTPKLPLPDFLIGGHAQALGAAILTRDARFYRRYFPTVPLITPE